MTNQIDWIYETVKPVSKEHYQHAQARQLNLTKPPGSLGQLETIAIRLSAIQQTLQPQLNKIAICVFAADHGVADENVSAFPQAVTGEMVKNFSSGGAAICVMAKELGASLEVVNLGTINELEKMPGVIDQRIAAGTGNFTKQHAMTEDQLLAALAAGRDAVIRAQQLDADVFIAGDMGIANTTSATALTSVLLSVSVDKMAGPGTGLNAAQLMHKKQVIQSALDFHQLDASRPLHILQVLGGFEIAAMSAAYIAASQQGIVVVVDGFIASAAALVALNIQPEIKDYLFFAHASAEPGHQLMMKSMEVMPLLDLKLRLGEASGAALIMPLMRMACALQNNMATFEQADVSNKV